MPISRHQMNVLEYFHDVEHLFIGFLFCCEENNKCLIITDFLPYIVKFLEAELKKEMSNYSYRSVGYNQLIDMLIEINITKPSSEMANRLTEKASNVFRKQVIPDL